MELYTIFNDKYKSEEKNMNQGFSISPMPKRADKALIERFKNAPTSVLSDSLNRLYGNMATLTPYHKEGRLVGSAFTIKTRPGDNLMIHKAIELAIEGDVLVIDGGGDLSQALLGEIMLTQCKVKKLAGIIVNGAIRDVVAFREGSFPTYAKGVTHKGPYKDGPGEINVPISFDDLLINPGDIIVGDEDGIINIPVKIAEKILNKALEKDKQEREKIELIKEGVNTPQSFISDKRLKELGCSFYN